MRALLPALILASSAMGCANQQLRFSTLRQTSTLPDLQQKQVMENFARLASNAGDMPYYAISDTGIAAVTDGGSTGFSVSAIVKAFPTWDVSALSANRSITETWNLKNENNPDRLKAMRAAYLNVINPSVVEPRDAELLNAVIQNDPSYALKRGWVCTGRKWDVPWKNAWLVGRYGSTYAWVMPENAAEFSRFVLLILDIETIGAGGAGAPAALAPPMTPAPSASPFQPRLFDQSTGFNPGLFLIPRPR